MQFRKLKEKLVEELKKRGRYPKELLDTAALETPCLGFRARRQKGVDFVLEQFGPIGDTHHGMRHISSWTRVCYISGT